MVRPHDLPAEEAISPLPVTLWWARVSDWHPRMRVRLSGQECRDQERKATVHAATTYALGRVMTRVVVGHLTGLPPARAIVRAPDDARGSRPPTAAAPLHFSLSRAGDRLVLATCPDAAVGVDIELAQVRTDAELALMAAPRDVAELRQLPAIERQVAAARNWTRREAISKLTGDGLRVRPWEIETTAAFAAPRLLAYPGRPALPDAVSLLDVVSDYDNEARANGGNAAAYQASLAVATTRSVALVHRQFVHAF